MYERGASRSPESRIERLNLSDGEACIVIGELRGNPIDSLARIVEEMGRDENGRNIDVIIGATEVQGGT